jgi:hypothetical protein
VQRARAPSATDLWPPIAVVRSSEATIAVVGGTGAYEGARGSITDRDLPHGRTGDTIHLLP